MGTAGVGPKFGEEREPFHSIEPPLNPLPPLSLGCIFSSPALHAGTRIDSSPHNSPPLVRHSRKSVDHADAAAIWAIYMIYQPKPPYLSVPYAHLDRLDYDQSGLLSIQMTLAVVAENDNRKAHASFSDMGFMLRFHGIEVAELALGASFDIAKNSSVALTYVVPAAPLPLDEAGMAEMDAVLKERKVRFELVGQARTRWRMGVFLFVRFWTQLDCKLQFSTVNETSIGLDCTSK